MSFPSQRPTLRRATPSSVPDRAGPSILAVLNCTPDSFSDGGKYQDAASIERFLDSLAGADGVDIGGESTAPGRAPISAEEEISRIEPALSRLAPHLFVSIDTYKSETAAWALEHGAQLINDVSALRADPKLARVVAEHRASICLMYSKAPPGLPHVTSCEQTYVDLIATIGDFFEERIEFCLAQGIDESKIILDPGMGGFLSPDPEYSWELLRRLPELRVRFAAFPFLIGTSRKGFLGGTVADRDPSSQLTALIAYLQGVDIVRTHNPAMAAEFFAIWARTKSSPE